MSITWGEIVRKVRYKGNYDKNQEADNEFMFYDAALEALSHLQHDCPSIGVIDIPVYRSRNLLHGLTRLVRYEGQPLSFTAKGVKALRYTVIGTAQVRYHYEIPTGHGTVSTYDRTRYVSGEVTSANVNTSDNGQFTATFTPGLQGTSFIIADIAFFDNTGINGEVPQISDYFHYDLRKLASDFLEMIPQEPVRYVSECCKYSAAPAIGYRVERDYDLFIDSRNEGVYKVYYHKQLTGMIPADPKASAKLDLDDTQVELLVCYMAYQIEKYNDIQIAYTYLNDYNTQLAAHMNRPQVNDVPVCLNTKGWW